MSQRKCLRTTLKVALGLVLVTSTGCFAMLSGVGGDSATPETLDQKRLGSLKKVALIGVCSYASMGVRQGGAMVRSDVDSTLAQQIAVGFDAEFSKGYTQAQVVSLAEVKSVSSMPRGVATPRAVCPDGLHPFEKRDGGALSSDRPNPSAGTMKSMAEALDVDAVFAVLAHPGMAFRDVDNANTKVTMDSGDIHPSLLVGVSRTGDFLVVQEISGEAERPDHATADRELAGAFGQALARAAIATLTGK